MENTRFKSEIPPCERGFGCCHMEHCFNSDDKCQQLTAWQAEGVVNLKLNREPKKLIKKLKAIRNSSGALKPAILKRQNAVHEILKNLSWEQMKELGPLIGYKADTLHVSRFRGLSISFIEAMESLKVKNYLAKQREAA